VTEEEVLAKHFVMWHWTTDRDESDGDVPPGEWRCSCGLKFGFSDTAIKHQAEEIRKARGLKPWDDGWTYGRIVERDEEGDPVKVQWIGHGEMIASRDHEHAFRSAVSV
jgi:hypothetical protein